MYGIIEAEERNKRILVLLLNFLCRLLEAGQHGTLTAGQMLAGISVLPDFCKYLLHNDKLIRHEREVFSKFSCTGIAFHIQNGTAETEQVTQNGIIPLINIVQISSSFWFLFQNALLDDFIHRGRR